MDEISSQHKDICWGWGNATFWSNDIFQYDIIHFQWPQAFMADENKKHSLEDFLFRIHEVKKKGIKIVATCHDLRPHYKQCAEYKEAISIVYNNADAILHLGEYSKNIFIKQFPDRLNWILPHHVYDTIYKKQYTREESLKKLNLDPNFRYILCLGMFRSTEEQKLIINISKQLKKSNIKILAPAFMEVKHRPHLKFLPTFSQFLQFFYQVKYGIICTGNTWVPVQDEDIPYYYGAADIALIHRLKILNSGNAILPLLFNKIVIGPDVGNVSEILKQENLPLFNVKKINEIGGIIQKALESSNDVKRNFKYPAVNSTHNAAKKLYEYYTSLLQQESTL